MGLLYHSAELSTAKSSLIIVQPLSTIHQTITHSQSPVLDSGNDRERCGGSFLRGVEKLEVAHVALASETQMASQLRRVENLGCKVDLLKSRHGAYQARYIPR